MPGATKYLLAWSAEQEKYLLFAREHQDHALLQGDESAWFAWLAAHTSFAFQGRQGRLNLLKEARSRGEDGYWYAYQRHGSRMLKRYAGRSAALTMERLEAAAQALSNSLNRNSYSHDADQALGQATANLEEASDGANTPLPSQAGQQPMLLLPKLRLPRLPSSLVTRESLLARLDVGLECKLTLLTAPAGFGKTTLVRQWIERQRSHHRLPPVAWVSLDPEDDDPQRFWRYLLTACQAFEGEPSQAALAQLSADQPPFALPSLKAALTIFLNEVAHLSERHVLVLEDYHVITASHVHDSLAFLLNHLPDTLRLVIITRSEPPLPLARWRAKGDLYELRASDLRFSQEEMALFLGQALPFALAPETLSRLEAHLEGWITGLRLLTLALQGCANPQEVEHTLALFTGSHRFLLDYFVAEVLSAQSEEMQTFLLRTSVLGRMTTSLCAAITGGNDSAHHLEALERAGLFLQSLDDPSLQRPPLALRWYRYHTLFAEAMRAEAGQRLGEHVLRECLSRASRWYESQGMLAEAIEAALQASEWARAADYIERYLEAQSLNERYVATLLRWLEQLPERTLESHPSLCLAYALTLLFTLDRSAPTTKSLMQAPFEMAERSWCAEGNGPKLGELLAVRAQAALWQDDLAEGFALARQACELLPADEALLRGMALLVVGLEFLYAGKPNTAGQTFQEAQALFEAVGNIYGRNAAIILLGNVCLQRGELHRAEQLYRHLFAEAGEDLLDRGDLLLCLARLSYEWNDLQEAERLASQVLDLARQHRDEIGKYHSEAFLLIPASLVLARVQHASGRTAPARRLLHELVALTQERGWLYLNREVLACQARVSLAVGDLAAAQRWSLTCTEYGEDVRIVQQEQEALVRARLLMAQGEVLPALRLLEHWRGQAQAGGRVRSELEIQLLVALAHFALDNLPMARRELKVALTMARSEGYQRLFLDEGESLVSLLRALLPDLREEPLITYAQSLLLAFARQGTEQHIPPRVVSALPNEPLSPQEQRVLRLLASGRSNPEIAQELIVSINTVKTQVQSIYRKLNVGSRWEAREAAQRLNIL